MNKKEDFFKFIKREQTCWVWTGSKFKNGYGRFHFKNKALRAHRFSYELHRGPILDKLVCHSCDNPICVNPKHLFLGQDNMTDCKNKGRRSVLLGEKSGRSRLKEHEVLAIRQALTKNFTLQYLANKFKISTTLVAKIRDRKLWKHI